MTTSTHDLLHAQYETPPPPPPPDRHSTRGRVIYGLVLIHDGVGWMLDELDILAVTAALALPVALTALGVALMVASYDGAHPGLAAVGVVLSLVVVLGSVMPLDAFRGGIGERVHRPGVASELDDYRLAIGSMEIDLTDLALTTGVEFSAEVGIGELVIIVPEGQAVDVTASVEAGEITIFDDAVSGTDVEDDFRSAGFATADDPITMTLEVFLGSIEVVAR